MSDNVIPVVAALASPVAAIIAGVWYDNLKEQRKRREVTREADEAQGKEDDRRAAARDAEDADRDASATAKALDTVKELLIEERRARAEDRAALKAEASERQAYLEAECARLRAHIEGRDTFLAQWGLPVSQAQAVIAYLVSTGEMAAVLAHIADGRRQNSLNS